MNTNQEIALECLKIAGSQRLTKTDTLSFAQALTEWVVFLGQAKAPKTPVKNSADKG
jgi:hypothetical protein